MNDPDPAADPVAPPPVRAQSIFQTLRAALKGRVVAIRAHLDHARYGDHRATVAALTHLTDLVSDMFGPDAPEDSLRGALSDITAGRTDDARKALEAARATLRANGSGIEAERVEALVALIAAAEATLQAGDRADARNLIERALAMIELADPLTMTSLISVERFREELRAQRAPTGGVYRISVEPPVLVNGADRTLRFCYSDELVDRMGDTIRAAGWDIADYLRNPVALWAHDSSAPPIGGGRNVGVEGTRLMGDIEFAPPETYQFADTIYRLLVGKFLRAVSVGFLPTRHELVKNDPERPWGIDFLEQQLLEISVCPVPANPNALAEARRKGIDTRPLVEWAERVLDGGGIEMKRVLITRDELQRLRTAAKESSMTAIPRVAAKTRRASVQRDDGTADDDPNASAAIRGTCGRGPDEECGMKDPDQCSVHGGTAADPDSDTKLLAALRRLLRRKDAGDPGDDDPPVAHEDAIRLAHKSLATAKAFMTEGMTHHAKALSLLDDVVDALDADPVADPPPDTDPDPAEKAAQLARAAELRAKSKPA